MYVLITELYVLITGQYSKICKFETVTQRCVSTQIAKIINYTEKRSVLENLISTYRRSPLRSLSYPVPMMRRTAPVALREHAQMRAEYSRFRNTYL